LPLQNSVSFLLRLYTLFTSLTSLPGSNQQLRAVDFN